MDIPSPIYSPTVLFHCIQIKETVRSSLGISWNTMRHAICFAGSKYKATSVYTITGMNFLMIFYHIYAIPTIGNSIVYKNAILEELSP